MGPMMLPTRKLDVLVVEDNVPDARFVRLAMGLVTGVAIEVTEAKRLADALEALEQRPFDVVLLDLGLPDSQGLSTFSLLHSRFRDVPVVILSGLADDTTMFDAVRLGAQDYLIKGDFDAQLLVRVMRHAIERHRLLMQLSRSLGYVKNLLQTVERETPRLSRARRKGIPQGREKQNVPRRYGLSRPSPDASSLSFRTQSGQVSWCGCASSRAAR